MLPKKMTKNRILDQLHKGFVCVCMAVTVGAAGLLTYEVYHYYRYIRPMRKEMALLAEKELLAEGKSD